MDYEEYQFIRADIGTLENLLERMPEDHEIERISLEGRLKKQRAKLEGVTPPPRPIEFTVFLKGAGPPGSTGMRVDAFNAIIRAAGIAADGEERLLINRVKGDHIVFRLKDEETRAEVARTLDSLELDSAQASPRAQQVRETLAAAGTGCRLILDGWEARAGQQ